VLPEDEEDDTMPPVPTLLTPTLAWWITFVRTTVRCGRRLTTLAGGVVPLPAGAALVACFASCCCDSCWFAILPATYPVAATVPKAARPVIVAVAAL
jgi:hypothetical protein